MWHLLPLPNSIKKQISQYLSLRKEVQPSSLRQADAFSVAHDSNNCRDFLVGAVIDWHFRIQRPQHLARSLATHSRVFYFSNHFIDSADVGYQIEKLDPNLDLFQVSFNVPGAPAIYFDSPSLETLDSLKRSMVKFFREHQIVASVTILQHPFWYPLAKLFPNSLTVYDCMDHHEGFGNVPDGLLELESLMASRADLLCVTSQWLENHVANLNENVAVIRNAADFCHFAEAPEKVFETGGYKGVIGYFGAIAEWFDIELIKKVSESFPAYLVLLVGDDTVGAGAALSSHRNIKLTGEVKFADLPFYFHSFDVCLLPFKVLPLTLATNPVKVYEYLSAGKPVVSVDLPEIEQFGDLVYSASNDDEFLEKLSLALDESDSDLKVQRIRFAKAQTWSHRASALHSQLEKIKLPKISIIILTFNNLNYTKDCVDSVLHQSYYPNLEIIIVDNNSTDGTRAYLQHIASENPEIQVIINHENIGFAAGNNVGLAAATGDYLVILNNDTVVSKGWLLTMLRHFQNDSQLGILGPVTNNIGNEARIEVSGTTIPEVMKSGVEYTRSHMGETNEISTVAFFCVMLPRFVYESCGPMCEEYGKGFFEDDDYCRRIEALGMRISCAEDVFVFHHLSASFSKLVESERQSLFEKNKKIYEEKWGAWVPHKYRDH